MEKTCNQSELVLGFFCRRLEDGDCLVIRSKEFREMLDVLDPEGTKRRMVSVHVKVPEAVKEAFLGSGKHFFTSTCEALSFFAFGMDRAEKGISNMTAINPTFNLAFYPLVLNRKRVRRKARLTFDEEEVYESWSQIGSSGQCSLCGSRFHVASYTLPTQTGSVYLCPNCAKNDGRWKKPDFANFPA